MNDTLKKNMTWFVCGGLGILNYILFAIPYVSAYAEMGNTESYSNGVSGYEIMDMFDTDFSGVMCSLLQILVLIASIGLLANLYTKLHIPITKIIGKTPFFMSYIIE